VPPSVGSRIVEFVLSAVEGIEAVLRANEFVAKFMTSV